MASTLIEDRVDLPSSAYDAMDKRWTLPRDLVGGTLAMREAGRTWLPQEPRESIVAYDARLGRSVLYGAYADTLEKIVSKPFSKPVTVTDGLPARLESMEDNIDRNGNDITKFGRDLFLDAVDKGLSHFLVDYPVQSTAPRLDQARMAGINPYFTHVPADSLIGWRSKKGSSGEEILTQVRIKTIKFEPKGNYGEAPVEYVRVITNEGWELHSRSLNESKYTVEDSGPNRFPGGKIPLVTLYINQTGFMTARPPLENLAWLNLSHWQILSDVRNSLRWASIGMWYGTGLSDEDIEKGFEIGASKFLGSTADGAQFGVIEAKGDAIGIGNDALAAIEARMEVLGLQPFVRKTGTVTATGRAIDEARTQSNIQSWIRSLENKLEQGYEYSTAWIKEKTSDEFSVDVFSEFSISMAAEKDLAILLQMALNDRIPNYVFLAEVQRRGTLSDVWNIEEIDEEARQGAIPPESDEDDMGDDEGDEIEAQEEDEEAVAAA